MSTGLTLETVVPWGRSLAEYIAMFALSDQDLQRSILDCGGGPASFNAELTQQGGRVMSCDPVYQFSVAELEQRIQDTYPTILAGVRANHDRYVWKKLRSPEHLCEVRLTAMRQFLQDFPLGLSTGRYHVAELPWLPYGDRQFDLALCGHLLFTYSQHLSEEFHGHAIQELCRVAQEVRIFPVVQLSGDPAPVLDRLLTDLPAQGYEVNLRSVEYEFQKGGNQLLQVLKV